MDLSQVAQDLPKYSAVASIISFSVIGLIYMLSKILQDQRLEYWSKREVYEVFLTAIFALFISFLITNIMVKGKAVYILGIAGFGPFESEENFTDYLDYLAYPYFDSTNSLSSGGPFSTNPTGQYMSFVDASEVYLRASVAYISKFTNYLQNSIGNFYKISGLSRLSCLNLCLFGGSSFSFSPFSGFTSFISVYSMALNSASFFLLSAYIQYFLIAYFFNGFFIYFLPIGILLRTIPFFRNIGAIFISLSLGFYFLLPILYTFDILLTKSIFDDVPPDPPEIIPNTQAYWKLAKQVALGFNFYSFVEQYDKYNYRSVSAGLGKQKGLSILSITKYSFYSFFISTFLFSFNMLITGLFVRSVSRAIGEEIDIRTITRLI